jgi:hypothetical protein
MAEQATSTPSDPAARSDDVAELREELAASREEVLRLRDLLIAKDAELGAFKGQVTQLEAGSARLLNLLARIRGLLPDFVWSARAALRRGR